MVFDRDDIRKGRDGELDPRVTAHRRSRSRSPRRNQRSLRRSPHAREERRRDGSREYMVRERGRDRRP